MAFQIEGIGILYVSSTPHCDMAVTIRVRARCQCLREDNQGTDTNAVVRCPVHFRYTCGYCGAPIHWDQPSISISQSRSAFSVETFPTLSEYDRACIGESKDCCDVGSYFWSPHLWADASNGVRGYMWAHGSHRRNLIMPDGHTIGCRVATCPPHHTAA